MTRTTAINTVIANCITIGIITETIVMIIIMMRGEEFLTTTATRDEIIAHGIITACIELQNYIPK